MHDICGEWVATLLKPLSHFFLSTACGPHTKLPIISSYTNTKKMEERTSSRGPARPRSLRINHLAGLFSSPLLPSHPFQNPQQTRKRCYRVPSVTLSGFRSGTLKLSRTTRISDSNFFHCRGLLEATRMNTRLPTAVAETSR